MRSLPVVSACLLGVSVAELSTTWDRQRAVDKQNALPQTTWRAAINERFADLPVGASKTLCGVKAESSERLRDDVRYGKILNLSSDSLLRNNEPIPEAFDAAEHWPMCAKVINDIRDQSACGCCWAFAPAEAASDRMCIATNGTLAFPLSAEDLCFCACGPSSEGGCGGGDPADAWQYLSSSGAVTGAQQKGGGSKDDPFANAGLCKRFSLPHCHHHGPTGSDPFPAEGTQGCPDVTNSPSCPYKCDADSNRTFATDKYTFTGQTVTFTDAKAMQASIMSDGPLAATMWVTADFENYASGVFKDSGGVQLGQHAIRIVGWGVDGGVNYWKVANSWNRYWGEGGFFRIERGKNTCDIETYSTSTSPGAKWHPLSRHSVVV